MIKEFFRRNFVPVGKGRLLDLFDSDSSVYQAIFFRRVCFPSGETDTVIWWETEMEAFVQLELREKKHVQKAMFDHLLSEIRRIDESEGWGDSRGVKDGTSYLVAWGWKEEVSCISVKNPKEGSECKKLITHMEKQFE